MPRGGQDQKAGVLRQQMAALGDLAGGPMQPPIPRLEMKGRGTEHQQGHPTPLILRHVAQNLSHRGGVLQIMFRGHLGIEGRPLGGFEEAHRDGLQQAFFRG